jgi:tetratricopeptide (TPR) repeat protein
VIPALPDACAPPATDRRWGWILPAGFVVVLAAGRFVGGSRAPVIPVDDLYERASRAYAADQFEDAAEYARHALSSGVQGGLTAELQCLRGESLLRVGRTREALEAFDAVVNDPSETPYRAQALFGAVQARSALGDTAASEAARQRLLGEFGETPWAARLRAPAR